MLLDAFVIPRNIVRAFRSGNDLRGGEYEPIVTDDSYDDGTIRIRIKSERIYDTTVYIADVRIRDASLLKTGLAGDSFGRNLAEVTSSIAERNRAVFAINGDYYGFREKGYVLRNGYLYRSTSNTRYPYGEDLVILEDGSFEIVNEASVTAEELAQKGAQQIFSFGPALVDQGEVAVIEGDEVERAQITNPRTAIGILDPLHYLMVVSDGRTAESRGQMNYYVRGTYTRYNTDFAKDVLSLADLGFKQISVEPVVADPKEDYALREEDIDTLCDQYDILAKEMLKREDEGRGFNFFHFMIDLEGGPCVYKRLSGCGSGTEYLAVTPSGELYPCHQFVGEESFLLGNVDEGITNKELCERFKKCNVYEKKECGDCFAKFYCSGGCAANSFHFSKDINGSYETGCKLQRKRVECALMLQAARNEREESNTL